jgi:23S rRNA (uridine2552-2'-O)-methyltransferase
MATHVRPLSQVAAFPAMSLTLMLVTKSMIQQSCHWRNGGSASNAAAQSDPTGTFNLALLPKLCGTCAGRRYKADIWCLGLGLGVTESNSSSGREGGRSLKTRVNARKRTLSSTLWLERQLNDPYVARAKREGFRSRAAYKLLEIDARYRFLKQGQRIIDLGAAPGGWSQVCVRKVGADSGHGRVIGIDLLAIEPLPGADFKVLDFMTSDAPLLLKDWLGGRADVVLSDMAANATGHRKTDHLRIVGLVELAADFACEILTDGGAFLAKVFQGGTERELLARLKSEFAVVRHVKPRASRADSAELYVLATGFRGEGKR